MRLQISKLILLFFVALVIGQSQSPYLDIANELLVRKKLSKKLPDVFDNAKFTEMVNKLDNIAQINPKTHKYRLALNNPEIHWCYAQTYHLAEKSAESLEHYRKYKTQRLNSSFSIHTLFQDPINDLEIAFENYRSNLAHEIYATIVEFKNQEDSPANNQILDLQNKLNIFNEIKSGTQILTTDGIIGSQTKSAIYDFEENNPYFDSQKEIKSLAATSLEISSLASINQVTAIPQIDDSSIQSTTSENSGDNFIELSMKIIIDADKIKSIPGNSIAEILEYVLGLNIKRQGASDVLANISTFGGTSEQTLILLDGLKISNQQTLHHDLDLPINIDDIKQIEIYRNTAAREYGSGAVSGVINVITKNGRERNSYIATEFGAYALFNGNLAVNIPIGRSFHNLSFSDIYSSGYQTNTDYLKRTFYYKYSLQDGKSSTNFSFGHLIRGNGITNHLSNIYENQYESNATKFFNSKIIWDFDKIILETNMNWFDHRDELAFDKNIGGWDNYSNTEIGVNFNSMINWDWGISKPGFTYSRETNSNTTVKEIKRDNYSLSLQHNFSMNKLKINLGVSGNYYDDFGWFAAPGYQLVYNINNNANIYHQYDHGFRLPSFYEMYADDYIYNGNKNLEGESINSYEYGIQLYGSAMTMTISQFYKNNQNLIDWYPSRSGITKWTSTNISDVLTSGHNIQFELYPEIIKLLTFIHRFDLGYAYMNIEHNGEKNVYKGLTHYLKHQITFGLQYNLPFGIARSWYVRYEQPTAYDNRTVVDTQIHYRIWRIESRLNINNVFNLQYMDTEHVALPGRWIRFSLRYNL